MAKRHMKQAQHHPPMKRVRKIKGVGRMKAPTMKSADKRSGTKEATKRQKRHVSSSFLIPKPSALGKCAGIGLFTEKKLPKGFTLPLPYYGKRLNILQLHDLADKSYVFLLPKPIAEVRGFLDEEGYLDHDSDSESDNDPESSGLAQLRKGNHDARTRIMMRKIVAVDAREFPKTKDSSAPRKYLLRFVNGAKGKKQLKLVNVESCEKEGKIWFRTVKEVRAGAELILDYGENYWRGIAEQARRNSNQ